jgi:hypothetical protein
MRIILGERPYFDEHIGAVKRAAQLLSPRLILTFVARDQPLSLIFCHAFLHLL